MTTLTAAPDAPPTTHTTCALCGVQLRKDEQQPTAAGLAICKGARGCQERQCKPLGKCHTCHLERPLSELQLNCHYDWLTECSDDDRTACRTRVTTWREESRLNTEYPCRRCGKREKLRYLTELRYGQYRCTDEIVCQDRLAAIEDPIVCGKCGNRTLFSFDVQVAETRTLRYDPAYADYALEKDTDHCLYEVHLECALCHVGDTDDPGVVVPQSRRGLLDTGSEEFSDLRSGS